MLLLPISIWHIEGLSTLPLKINSPPDISLWAIVSLMPVNGEIYVRYALGIGRHLIFPLITKDSLFLHDTKDVRISKKEKNFIIRLPINL
jgi:hypothetical protein